MICENSIFTKVIISNTASQANKQQLSPWFLSHLEPIRQFSPHGSSHNYIVFRDWVEDFDKKTGKHAK